MFSAKLGELLKSLKENEKSRANVYEDIKNTLKYESLTCKEQKPLIRCFKEGLKSGDEMEKETILRTWVSCAKSANSLSGELVIELCSGTWSQRVISELFSTLIVDQSLNLEECFNELNDGVVRDKVVDTLVQVSSSIPLKPLLNFIHINVIRSIFQTQNDFTRSTLCMVVLKLTPNYGLQLCENEIQRHTFDNFKNVYVLVIEDLRKTDNKIWYQLCMFTLRYFGKMMHNEIELLNSLLSNIEHGFKSKTVEDKILSFDCWKVLIDISSLDRTYLCSTKQLRLLVKPLKVKLSRTDEVTCKRLEVWVHLLSALQENCLPCLEEFMNFCFEPQTPIIESTWSKRTEVLMNIIGHYEPDECCIHPQTFKLNNPVVNSANLLKYKNIVLNAVTVCSENMLSWEVKIGREKKIKCLWGSLIRTVAQLHDLDKELMLRDIFIILKTFLKKSEQDGFQDYFDDIIQPIFSIISSLDDQSWDYLILNEIIVFPIAQIMLNYSNIPEYRALAFIQLLRSCSKTSSRLDYFNRSCELLKSYTYNKTQLLCSYIWLELANELLSICRSPKDEFEAFKTSSKFLMCWICECQIPDNLKEMVLWKWSSIVTEIDVICEEFKQSLLEHFHHLFKTNPTVGSNILAFIPITIDKITEKSTVTYMNQVINIVLECLKNPCLKSNKVITVLPIISKISNNISKTEANEYESLGLKLFECVEYFLQPHQVYETLKVFKSILPKLSQSLKKKLPSKLQTIINDLTTHSDSDIAQDAISVVAELDRQELVKTPNFPKPAVSNRTVKIASMTTGGICQNKSLNLFAQAVQKSPISVKGSVINSMNQRNTRIMKIANALPTVVKHNNIEPNANSSDYVYIDSEVKLDYDKMVSHQKEVLRRRKEDIPALYQDLTQSQHSSESLSKSNDNLNVGNIKDENNFKNVVCDIKEHDNSLPSNTSKETFSLNAVKILDDNKSRRKSNRFNTKSEEISNSRRKSSDTVPKKSMNIISPTKQVVHSVEVAKKVYKKEKKRRYSDSQSLSQNVASLRAKRSSSLESIDSFKDCQKNFKIVPLNVNGEDMPLKFKISITNEKSTINDSAQDKKNTEVNLTITHNQSSIDEEQENHSLLYRLNSMEKNGKMEKPIDTIQNNTSSNKQKRRSHRSLLSLSKRSRSKSMSNIRQVVKDKDGTKQNNMDEQNKSVNEKIDKQRDIEERTDVKKLTTVNIPNKQINVLEEEDVHKEENTDDVTHKLETQEMFEKLIEESTKKKKLLSVPNGTDLENHMLKEQHEVDKQGNNNEQEKPIEQKITDDVFRRKKYFENKSKLPNTEDANNDINKSDNSKINNNKRVVKKVSTPNKKTKQNINNNSKGNDKTLRKVQQRKSMLGNLDKQSVKENKNTIMDISMEQDNDIKKLDKEMYNTQENKITEISEINKENIDNDENRAKNQDNLNQNFETIEVSQESNYTNTENIFIIPERTKIIDSQAVNDPDITICSVDLNYSNSNLTNDTLEKKSGKKKKKLPPEILLKKEISKLKMDIVGADNFVGIRKKRSASLKVCEVFKSLASKKRKRSQVEKTSDAKKPRITEKHEEKESKEVTGVGKDSENNLNILSSRNSESFIEKEEEPSQCLVTLAHKSSRETTSESPTKNVDAKDDVSDLKVDKFKITKELETKANESDAISMAESEGKPNEILSNLLNSLVTTSTLERQNVFCNESVVTQEKTVVSKNKIDNIPRSKENSNVELITVIFVKEINKELDQLSEDMFSTLSKESLKTKIEETKDPNSLSGSENKIVSLNLNEKEALPKKKCSKKMTKDEHSASLAQKSETHLKRTVRRSRRIHTTNSDEPKDKLVTSNVINIDSLTANSDEDIIESSQPPDMVLSRLCKSISKTVRDNEVILRDNNDVLGNDNIQKDSPECLRNTDASTVEISDTVTCDQETSILSVQQVSPEPVKLNLVDLDLNNLPTGLNMMDHQNLPGSPISEDIIDRNSELLNSTLDISPIRNDPISDQNNPPVEPETPTNLVKNPSSRSMMLMNLLPQGVKITKSPKSVIKKTPVNVIGSPSTDRVRRMMMKCNGKTVHDGGNVRDEQLEEINVLVFKKEVPSPFATPNRSILKRKASEAVEYGISPCPKRKRVNFSDPPTTVEKIYFKDQDEDCTSDILEVNQKKAAPIYPTLINCVVDIKEVLPDLKQENGYDNFLSLNIKTIGDLAKLTSTQVNQLEFLNNPKLSSVTAALNTFAEKYSEKEKSDEQEKSLEHSEDASLPTNGEAENNALLVNTLDKLKKYDEGVSELWQELKALCTKQQLLLIFEDLKELFARE